ncbi:sensor histidine kinase [Paenibacillus sp. GbtcB18]|uniref:cache domain-containing sensor histidine kinase n=1 Tax=Paenibacillus sp. GbtcB18 TaxID=2824763 RepID=UPI001C30001C|nr:sensor histidine kinase [Paenibacillus sp. GbtcB18]
MKPEERRRFVPFGYKLMLSYALCILVPVIIVGSFAVSTLVKSVREQAESSVQGTMRQIRDNIQYKIEDMRRLTDMLYGDTTLAKHLKHYDEGWVSYEATTGYLLPKMMQTIQSSSLRLWLSVYLHNETLREVYYNHDNIDPLMTVGKLYELYHMKRIEDADWYKSFPPERYGTTMQWRQIEDDAKFSRLSLLRRIVDTTNGIELREIGFIRVSAHLQDLFESVDYTKVGEGGAIYIVGPQGDILYSSAADPNMTGKTWNESWARNHLVLRQPLEGLDWSVVSLVPTAIMEKDADKVRMLTAIVCLISVLVIFFVGWMFSRFFSKRVTKIVSVLHAFREGEFRKRMAYEGRDEFAQIAAALNDMGQHTEGLIREVYLTNLQKKEAELESLQAQINPHFLYNTLSSISRLARFGDIDKLHRMVIGLAKFYRLTLNDGRTFIPLSKELEQVQAYVDIQSIKYGDRMEVLFDIQPEVNRYDTVKLIVQPFIENALQHAWCGDHIHIRISGEIIGGDIHLKIIDDGNGIPQDRFRKLFDPLDEVESGYGIRNVDQRIKLHFGKKYGVSLASRPGIGTAVLLRIPTYKHKKNRE